MQSGRWMLFHMVRNLPFASNIVIEQLESADLAAADQAGEALGRQECNIAHSSFPLRRAARARLPDDDEQSSSSSGLGRIKPGF